MAEGCCGAPRAQRRHLVRPVRRSVSRGSRSADGGAGWLRHHLFWLQFRAGRRFSPASPRSRRGSPGRPGSSGEDLKLKRPVALKFLPAEWSRDPGARERFFPVCVLSRGQEKRRPAGAAVCHLIRLSSSGDRHVAAEEDILNGVEQGDAVCHRLLEGLTAGDQAHTAGAFVDDRGGHCLRQVVGA